MRKRTKREILVNKVKFISVITLHEVYRLTLQKGGREVAKLRVNVISKDFEAIDVDSAIAVKAAEIRHGSLLPMADSIIAATSASLKGVCISDDPHLATLRSISTRWI
jgi:predicted nucleic acid-binding protein